MVAATPTLHSPDSSALRHLRCFILALGVVALGLLGSSPFFASLERPFMRRLLALPFTEKDQGMLMQRNAFRFADVLPIYGSSELRNEMRKRADQVFLTKPKGFQVCPVGAAGNTTLMMAQKIAAQGSVVRGHKVAFILSHTWFRRAQVPESQMAGNFSPLQAIRLLQNSDLSPALRERYIKRLLEFPQTLEGHPLLASYLQDLKMDSGWGYYEGKLLAPFIKLYGLRLAFEDHLDTLGAVVTYGIIGRGTWHAKASRLNWRPMIRRKEREVAQEDRTSVSQAVVIRGGPGDAQFIQTLATSREWEDYALLLDTLKELKAKPLIISVPMPGPSLNRKGVSREARDFYYRRIQATANERGFPAATFSHQDLAIDFLVGAGTHLDEKGWLYVNELLDEFFHDRVTIKRAGRL
jgi:D-alanine transfer protein